LGFNSFTFCAFFLVAYGTYLLARRRTSVQNALLLAASYVFYAFWDYRFVSLIIISTAVDYCIGLKLGSTTRQKHRKFLLAISIVVNLGLLGFFKYFGFFADSFATLLTHFGLTATTSTLQIVLPIGISFYTFQTLSYTIDVYRKTIKPTQNPVNFALFVSFFPQLVAGPIERASNMLPQIEGPRKIDARKINTGVFLILWGYFKKLVIADNLAPIVDKVFDSNAAETGIAIPLATFAFTIQLYCDFSGYTDIARGLARMLGFELTCNFRLPFFARNPRELWARWHISLSSWLRDYLYIPLGGNRGHTIATYRNLLFTMLLGGLWHGAAWHFILWGLFHGLLLVGHRQFELTFGRQSKNTNWMGNSWRMAATFFAWTVGMVFFRATSGSHAFSLLAGSSLSGIADNINQIYDIVFFCLPLLIMQVAQARAKNLLVVTSLKPRWQVLVYSFLIIWLYVFAARDSSQFIYFQF
jgi:alginate O-acetyltransferase complex protein AlgI